MHDDLWSSLLSLVNEDLVRAVEEKISQNRRFTIMPISLLFLKFHDHFFTKLCLINLSFVICAHCVLKMLREGHKLKQQASTLDFLTQYSEKGKNFLTHVVTGNETWVSHEAPKSKQQSMQCRHTSSPTKMKFKQTASTRKVMCTMFWDKKGVLLVDFLPQVSQSTQVSVAIQFKNCDARSRISDMACLAGCCDDS